MGYEPVDVFVKDTTPAKNPVLGVVVKIFSEDGKIVYGMQQTDEDGKASFLLPSEFTYQVRFYKFGFTFTQPQIVEVLPSPLAPGQSNIFDASGSSVAPPVPNDVRLCTAYGYFRDITGAPQANVDIHFIAKFDPVLLDGAGVVKERAIRRTDENGYMQVNLIRNGLYDCTIQGEEDIVRHTAVPDAPNVNLPDLIFPVVDRVVASPPGPYTLAVGQEITVELHIMTSDGNDLGRGFNDVIYRLTDCNVVTYTSSGTSSIVFRGIAPGTSSLTLERANKSIVRIPDPGILGQPLVVTVTP